MVVETHDEPGQAQVCALANEAMESVRLVAKVDENILMVWLILLV